MGDNVESFEGGDAGVVGVGGEGGLTPPNPASGVGCNVESKSVGACNMDEDSDGGEKTTVGGNNGPTVGWDRGV